LTETSRSKGANRDRRYSDRAAKWVFILGICALGISTAVLSCAQSQQAQSLTTNPQAAPDQLQPGSVSGTVVDQDGAVIANVNVRLTQAGAAPRREKLSDDQGYFTFANVTPGPFQLSFAASGFAPLEQSGVLHAGEDFVIPQIALGVARNTVDVEVTLPQEQVAEDEIKIEEKQRLLGVFPNFYVSYDHKPVPLTTKLKFQLAWRTIIDPVSFVIVGASAGIEQADDAFSGYGQGAQGYAKRYGAGYADLVSGIFIGSAILPSLLKQDPRYFYKGTGSRKSRLLYAIANSVICKGDNGHWQPNYSFILGDIAAGGISNLYYPAQNRNGAALTFENTGLAVGFGAVGNIFQEFLFRKLTPHAPPEETPKP
jgi:carboxypeptidase family protein